MIGETFKTGELIYTPRPRNGSYFAKIVEIVDNKTKESFYEKEIIRGHGNLNTDATIVIDIIAEDSGFGQDFRDITIDIEMLESPIRKNVNPHNIYKYHTIKEFEKKYRQIVKKVEENYNFVKKYSITRDEKIELLLEK